MAHPDKLAKLVAVFDQFHASVAQLDDPTAKRLAESWAALRHEYVSPTGAPRSAFATGMEQGLREMPMAMQRLPPRLRTRAAQALANAISAHCPEFLVKEEQRLAKIKARGHIRSESEFHLVRHHVDVLEGEPDREQELRQLYELVNRFEVRGGRL